MNRVIPTAFLLLSAYCVPAQSIKGKLFGSSAEGKEILPGATLHFVGSAVLVTVNENGVFELPLEGISDKRIIAAEAGYETDTIDPGDKTYLSVTLRRSAQELRAVTVSDQRAAYLSRGVLKTEVITQRELSKAACCDLAGCFGTQASVQPQTTNVVSNAQELRILGLSGVYNQVLFDGLPMIQGLSYTYGISTYPGTIVDNIYVAKGTASVLQGYESISGQINLESKQPDKAEKLYLNAYVNSFGERHLNANLASALGRKKKWHSLLALHMVQPAAKTDGNKDGFLDLPQLRRYVVYNKWKYGNERQRGFAVQVGLRLVSERRIGGQMDYDDATDRGSNTVYGQSIRYLQPEAYVKSAYRFSGKHALALAVSGFYQDQHSWLGTTRYQARQATAYVNLQHEWSWHLLHSLKYGASFRYQDLAENISFSDQSLGRTYAGDYQTKLMVPGVFIENTFRSRDEKVSLITGVRADRHQVWGTYTTPRAMIRYLPGRGHTLRASAGSGWRQVNLFSEQVTLLAGSRDIEFAEALKPESAVNWGLSDTYTFEVGPQVQGTLSVDFYSTRFRNQFFPDYDTDPAKALIRNFEGVSRSHGLQAEASFVLYRQLELRAAYNYLDVYRMENGVKTSLPFNPRNRAMAAVSWASRSKRWQCDLNAHWFDRMRLPNTSANPAEYRRPSYSVPYATVNIQATFRVKDIELYSGCENIGNYRQADPIVSAHQPFGRYFDLSSVWGPTRGREWYLGIRYRIR
ncbi:MAG: TonB-dependent receptor plug domain-containing protein [Chitinophagaceae bacterium]|nr:TonB-dependent receptor plug domain-containing protein [Chitinophagaceae bacterium]